MSEESLVLRGVVQRGAGDSRTGWALPTANLVTTPLLKPGFYFCMVFLEQHVDYRDSQTWDTVEMGKGLIIRSPLDPILELYIEGYSGELYGHVLELHTIHRLDTPTLCTMADLALGGLSISADPVSPS